MPSPQDEDFVRFAVASGHLSEAQAGDALAAVREIEGLGGSVSVGELLTRRGALTEAQVVQIRQGMAAARPPSKIPRALGGFELVSKVGQGGMGSVFKARQVDLDRTVAVKVLKPRLARNAKFVEQFLREARSAGRLNHANIVAAIDVGESEGFYYFAMEFVDGETLHQLLARDGPLPEGRAIGIATEVAKALDHAHHKDLVHRDIKPDNIMLTRDGRVRVTDFGLAKVVDKETLGGTDADRFLGTPAYMAPEQVRADPHIDCRADIFSLGVTLYEMLTGQRPFTGANTVAIAAAVIAEPLPSIRKQRPDASLAICRLVEKMTAKDPAKRPATPADVISALDSAASAPRLKPRAGGSAVRRGRPRPKKTPVGAYLAAGAIVLALAALAILLATRAARPRRPPSPVPVVRPPSAVRPIPTTTATAARERLLASLRKALSDADTYAADNPVAYASQIKRYNLVLADFPPQQQQYLPREGQALLRKLCARIEDLGEERRTAADKELARREAEAGRLLKAALDELKTARLAADLPNTASIGRAPRLFDTFPNELRTDGIATQLERRRDHYLGRAEPVYVALDSRAKALVKQKLYTKAKSTYAVAKTWHIPELAARADEAIAEVDKLIAQVGSEALRKAQQLFPAQARAVLGQLRARAYAEAAKAVAAALVDPALAPVRERVRRLDALVRGANALVVRAGIGVKKFQPGEMVRVAGLAGKFVRFHEGKIYLDAGAVIARPLVELGTGEIIALALTGYGDPRAQAEPAIGLFLLAEGDPDGARKRLAAAKAKAIDVDAALDVVAHLGSKPCPTCKGAKSVPCPACKATGVVAQAAAGPCDACAGKGTVPCPKCAGKGTFTCRFCKGTGRVARGRPCPRCKGRGTVDCPACQAGVVPCKKCGGTGKLSKAAPCPKCNGAKTIPCTTCGAAGRLAAPDLVVPTPPATPPKPPAPSPTP